MSLLSDLDAEATAPIELRDELARLQMGELHSVERLFMHTVWLVTLDRRTFVLLAMACVIKTDETVDDRFAFFSREELLEQQDKLQRAEAELSKARQQLYMSCTARS